MRRLISRKGIRYYFSCGCMSSFDRKSKPAFFMLVTKIQRPKILKWKKKKDQLITIKKKRKEKKTRQPQSMTPARAFSNNQLVGTGNTQ